VNPAPRVLLADDSPHAQRMGERILSEEGFEVVSVTDGDTALLRLADADPDIVLADVFLPGKSGFEICHAVKSDPRRRHTSVVLIAGLLEPLDEAEATRAGADSTLRKPFEASVVLSTLRPLVEKARQSRGLFPPPQAVLDPPAPPSPAVQPPPIDPERVRAAITIALDRSLPGMVQQITEQVLIALGQ
jgi:CheY-like chemotaxis protein